MKITKIINKYDILFKLKDRDEECKKFVKKLQRMLLVEQNWTTPNTC